MGSIPACAGEPPERRAAALAPRVYPRVCGGAAAWGRVMKTPRGLSPRVRGSLLSAVLPPWRPGSIPACAGEPPSIGALVPSCRVYPRVCGGADACRRVTSSGSGLSPRVRGSHAGANVVDAAVWSIPACAGEPVVLFAAVSSAGVYPRVCGGAMPKVEPVDTAEGLSPRVRGSHQLSVC